MLSRPSLVSLADLNINLIANWTFHTLNYLSDLSNVVESFVDIQEVINFYIFHHFSHIQ